MSQQIDPKYSPGFSIWKEAGSEQYRWLAVYSNNYRDDDRPSEIISERSHKQFTEMVRKGFIDYPELWLWHVPLVWGKADGLDYHDGFAIATGVIYPGFEELAENISKQKNLAVSHGMPKRLIRRDPTNPSVITFHVTTEISPLPGGRAANRRTGFVVHKGEEKMPIPQDKKDWFIKELKVPADRVGDLEAFLDTLSKEAEDLGVESKEAAPALVLDPAVPATPAADPTPTPAPVVAEAEKPAESEEKEPAKKEANFASKEEVAAVISEVLQPVVAAQLALTEQITSLTKELKDLQKADAEKVKEIRAETPPMSLKEMVASRLIGNPKARIPDGDPLADQKPKEAPVEPGQGPTLVPYVNGLMQNNRSAS